MPISLRAAALRTALERALDTSVQATPTEDGIRIRATAPAVRDHATWEHLLAALRTADRWGSSDTAGEPEIWADITEGQPS